MQSPLVTILTPTFNDVKFLPLMLKSIQDQSYTNWQHIIINDGSTDGTKEFLDTLIDSRILVIHQENADQLNALYSSLDYIRGELICMLHSDDAFVNSETLQNLVNELIHSDCDGLIADITTMNKRGDVVGLIDVLEPNKDKVIEQIIVQMGSNPLSDPFFLRKTPFFNALVPNYLINNTIYYLDSKKQSILNLKKVNSWYLYRVFEENYIQSDLGKFVASSGQFRNVSKIFKMGFHFKYDPTHLYIIQRLFRGFKWPHPFEMKKELAWGTIARYYKNWAKDYARKAYPQITIKLAEKIAHSASVQKNSTLQKPLKISSAPEKLLGPADARKFYKLFESGELDPWYLQFLECDYDHIICPLELKSKIAEMLNFYSLFYKVQVS